MTTATEARLDRMGQEIAAAVNNIAARFKASPNEIGPLLIAMGSTLISDHFGNQHAASVLYAAADERAACQVGTHQAPPTPTHCPDCLLYRYRFVKLHKGRACLECGWVSK